MLLEQHKEEYEHWSDDNEEEDDDDESISINHEDCDYQHEMIELNIRRQQKLYSETQLGPDSGADCKEESMLITSLG